MAVLEGGCALVDAIAHLHVHTNKLAKKRAAIHLFFRHDRNIVTASQPQHTKLDTFFNVLLP